jgi:hypothetical protein
MDSFWNNVTYRVLVNLIDSTKALRKSNTVVIVPIFKLPVFTFFQYLKTYSFIILF